MTPQEAVAILESLKDLINDNGKRELSAIQNAISSWEMVPEKGSTLFPLVVERTPAPAPVVEKKPKKAPEPKKVARKPKRK